MIKFYFRFYRTWYSIVEVHASLEPSAEPAQTHVALNLINRPFPFESARNQLPDDLAILRDALSTPVVKEIYFADVRRFRKIILPSESAVVGKERAGAVDFNINLSKLPLQAPQAPQVPQQNQNAQQNQARAATPGRTFLIVTWTLKMSAGMDLS